jgi:lipoate synthase
VALMQLKYVVLTSVNRDDLPDGGGAAGSPLNTENGCQEPVL